MRVLVCITATTIAFGFTDDLAQHINAWTTGQDTIIFHEQVATGSFRGQQLSADTWDILKRLHAKGHIQPYYGASGGGYRYTLCVTGPQSTVEVTNALIPEPFTCTIATASIQPKLHEKLLSRLQRQQYTNPFPDTITQRFVITNRELTTLRTWKYWDQDTSVTGQYQYTFIGTTLGLTIQIRDTTTHEMIDITNYDDW